MNVYVEGWRRAFDGFKEFITFRILLERNGNEIKRIEKRYSEFLEFHNKVKRFIGENEILVFPSKNWLKVQTDIFAERRTKDLDAYLKVLMHLIRAGNGIDPAAGELLNEFFGMKDEVKDENGNFNSNNRRKDISVLRTPNRLNSEIDRLRSSSSPLNSVDFDSLQSQIRHLQEKLHPTQEELRCIEKFYTVKREREIERIKRGEFSGREFDLEEIEVNGITRKRKENEIIRSTAFNPVNSVNSENPENPVNPVNPVNPENHLAFSENFENSVSITHSQSIKDCLRGQESILKDLVVTLNEQKKLSQEICAEVIEHHRIIDKVERKQEGAIEEFKDSSDRVKKLQ